MGLHTPEDTTYAATAGETSDDVVFWPSCSSARAAGAAPIYSGQPGYRPPLDRDGDGVACEPVPGQ
ncbi:excalibur calcium-binding domain-containing protein [Novosphingobium ovatum]|nr:excalibur calcium-binding domain-containing protein [Novosphingobium ovatum]